MSKCRKTDSCRKGGKHGTRYIVEDKTGYPYFEVYGSYYPELDAARAYASARSEFAGVQHSVLVYCDDTRRADRSYEKGKQL